MLNLFLLAVSLFLVLLGAEYAIKYASNLAAAMRLPKYAIGFIVVTVISILPETFISINAAFQDIPDFALGMLFGSNVADLTLVLAFAAFATKRGIKVEKEILEHNKLYPLFIAFPIFFGLDGSYTRLDGLILIFVGVLFHLLTFKRNYSSAVPKTERHPDYYKNLFLLFCSMGVLLLGSDLTVKYGVGLAESIGISPVLIGMFVVGIGTTLPELSFAVKAMKCKGECLAIGNVLGTAISDATIVVGIVALINPFVFPQKIVYITAMFMVLSSIVLLLFLRSDRTLTKKEGIILVLFYLVFMLTEYMFNI